MCTIVSFSKTILETLAACFDLSALLYLCEVAGDGSVLAGVELELPIDGVAMGPQRRFFWCTSWLECLDAYDQAALQAIDFLQGVYGFVIRDYNYACMMDYRESTRYVVLLAARAARQAARSEREVLRVPLPTAMPSENLQAIDWALLCSRLLASVRFI
uniref:Uncharacterized protein n=1 Tax=Avena sativa TaxID=4498 RepID=A0ACD5ZQC3_AVESA